MSVKTTAGVRDVTVTANAVAKNREGEGRIWVQQNTLTTLLMCERPSLGSTVTKATLWVKADRAAAARTIQVRRVTKAWNPATVTWKSKPTVITSAISTSVPEVTAGQWVPIDWTVIAQTAASGAAWYGLEVTASGSASTQMVWFSSEAGADNAPYVEVEWAEQPDPPSGLTPSWGVVSVPSPMLRWDFHDQVGDTDLSKIHVRVIDWTGAVVEDSGEIDAEVPECTPTYAAAEGVPFAWEARHADGSGGWSGWSQRALVVYRPLPTVTITGPAAGPIADTTPTVQWTCPGQAAWRVQVWDPERNVAIYDTGKRAGTGTDWTIPSGKLTQEKAYELRVAGWDAETRVAVPSGPTYTQATRTITVTTDPAKAKVVGLTATWVGPLPHMRLSWLHTSTPDAWVIKRDGIVIAELDGTDLGSPASGFTWVDTGFTAWRDHTWTVHPKDGGKLAGSPVAHGRADIIGQWLVDPGRGRVVWIVGGEEGTREVADSAAEFEIANSPHLVRRVNALRAHTGEVSGQLTDEPVTGTSWKAFLGALYAMKTEPTRPVWLLSKDTATQVLLKDVVAFERPDIAEERSVKFGWIEVGTPEWDR